MENRPYSCRIIQAGDWDTDLDFQGYYDEDGNRIPEGEDVGVEISEGDRTETTIYLLDGIYFP